jgi:hypothetical protein
MLKFLSLFGMKNHPLPCLDAFVKILSGKISILVEKIPFLTGNYISQDI